MSLINLEIFKDGVRIRNIQFKDGLNIITNSENNGNQIGKSTVLRSINFCLGSDGKNIWHAPESKTNNKNIEELVTSGRIEFTLNLYANNKLYSIRRKIHQVHQKNRTIFKIHSSINGETYDTNNKFKAALAPVLGLSITNTSYSSIKNRFIRLDKITASNIYHYLHQRTTDRQYILYYSYLFGFSGHESLAKEIQFGEDKRTRQNRISMLLNGSTEQSFKDKLKSIDDEIEILKRKEDEFDFKDSQNTGIINLKSTREKIANITSEIAKLDIKISYSEKTIETYNAKKTDVDAQLIEKIYNEAKVILPNLNKTLSDTIKFHDQVISKKVSYLKKQSEKYKESAKELKSQLDVLLINEKSLFTSLVDESHLSGFMLIENEIQSKYEERGRISVIIDEIEYESNEIATIDKEISRLRKSNKQQMAQLIQNVEIFNKHLKLFTRAIFGDFSLSFNVSTKSDTNEIEFSVVNNEKVSGDGAPRAAALAADMAFVQFAKETGSHLPDFTIQDYLESSDQDKLATLAKIANNEKIQVIISILKDKLVSLDKEFIDGNTVLALKKNDKFFKVD